MSTNELEREQATPWPELEAYRKEMLDVRAEQIRAEFARIEKIVLAKNQAYGDSALNPVRIFSKIDPIESIKSQLDHKLSRIARGDVTAFGESPNDDLIGYLILLNIAERGEG